MAKHTTKKESAVSTTDDKAHTGDSALNIDFDKFVRVHGKGQWQEKRGININGKEQFVTIDAAVNFKKNGGIKLKFEWTTDQITFNDKIDKATLAMVIEGFLIARDEALRLKKAHADSLQNPIQFRMGFNQ